MDKAREDPILMLKLKNVFESIFESLPCLFISVHYLYFVEFDISNNYDLENDIATIRLSCIISMISFAIGMLDLYE